MAEQKRMMTKELEELIETKEKQEEQLRTLEQQV